ncbi:MAG: serpin family protein [Chloroflexota bacterium]
MVDRKLFGLMVVLLTLVVAVPGCAPAASADVVRSSEPRETEVSVPPDDLDTLVAGNNEFAFDLYRQVADDSGNLFYSPYSVSLALAMTYAGVRGETEEQMARAMHFDLPQGRLHPAFNRLDQELASRGEGAEGEDEGGFRLNIVNAIWGQKDYSFRQEFLDTLARNYGAGLRVVDFETAPEQCREIINEWVEKQTEERIKDLIAQGMIDELTRLVLTNAIYFNAAWASQFEEDATSPGTFHLLDGGEVEVPMMHQTESFRHVKNDNFQAVELPYDGHELSMVVLMPAAGEFEEFERSLDNEMMAEAIDSLQSGRVKLTMPKFRVESSFNLNDALSEMGMGVAFEHAFADFSGMDGTRRLYITDVVHKAFVDVDEKGTEAAAATAVMVGLESAPAEPVSITIDHPFVFLIRDMETGTILFTGRVTNPA